MNLPHPIASRALLASIALSAFGCASSDALDPDGVATRDASTAHMDAGVADPEGDAASYAMDAAGYAMDATAMDGAAPSPPRETGDLEGVGCFDFADTDGDGAADCDDPDCASTPLCCVGRPSEGCCQGSTTTTIAFSSCDGTGSAALSSCVEDAIPFGSPAPELRDHAFVPVGGDRSDSGIMLATRVDPQVEHLRIRARITAGEWCGACVDAVAFGLAPAPIGAETSPDVEPDIAVMVSTAHGEIRMLVGGGVARTMRIESVRTMLGAAPGAPIDYELETSPLGRASLRARAGETSFLVFTDIPYLPRGPAAVLLYGRSIHRSVDDPPPASIHEVSLHASLCDAPRSLARTSEPILPDRIDPWWLPSEGPRNPSVLTYDHAGETRTIMAFEYRGRIHLARGFDDGHFRALADPEVESNAKVAPSQDEPWRAAAVLDPELVRADDHLEIWFTGVSTDGTRSIGRAVGAPGFSLVFSHILRLLPAEGDDSEWDGPSYLELGSATPSRRLLAARRGRGASAEIIIHEIGEGDALAPLPATTDDGFGEATDSVAVRRVTTSPLRFDADEIAAPALVHYGGVFRLYYAGRRGTRWAIGLAISQDGRYWHAANDGLPVLTGSGAGFDSLSVRDPEPVLASDEVRLYYTGTNGLETAIGLSRVRAPLNSAP